MEKSSHPATDRASGIGRCRWLARVGFVACFSARSSALTPHAASSLILPWVVLKAIEPFLHSSYVYVLGRTHACVVCLIQTLSCIAVLVLANFRFSFDNVINVGVQVTLDYVWVCDRLAQPLHQAAPSLVGTASSMVPTTPSTVGTAPLTISSTVGTAPTMVWPYHWLSGLWNWPFQEKDIRYELLYINCIIVSYKYCNNFT
jgi:hypothetical protein